MNQKKQKNNSEAWSIFMSKYFYCYHLILYKKLFKEHLLNTFNQCLIDKIYQLETRHTLNLVTDENLNINLIEDGLSIYYEALNEIKKKKISHLE